MGWYIEATEDGRYIVHIERPLDISDEEMRKMIDSAINEKLYDAYNWKIIARHTLLTERMGLIHSALTELGFVELLREPDYVTGKGTRHVYRKFARGGRRNDIAYSYHENWLESLSEDEFLRILGKFKEEI